MGERCAYDVYAPRLESLLEQELEGHDLVLRVVRAVVDDEVQLLGQAAVVQQPLQVLRVALGSRRRRRSVRVGRVAGVMSSR